MPSLVVFAGTEEQIRKFLDILILPRSGYERAFFWNGSFSRGDVWSYLKLMDEVDKLLPVFFLFFIFYLFIFFLHFSCPNSTKINKRPIPIWLTTCPGTLRIHFFLGVCFQGLTILKTYRHRTFYTIKTCKGFKKRIDDCGKCKGAYWWHCHITSKLVNETGSTTCSGIRYVSQIIPQTTNKVPSEASFTFIFCSLFTGVTESSKASKTNTRKGRFNYLFFLLFHPWLRTLFEGFPAKRVYIVNNFESYIVIEIRFKTKSDRRWSNFRF